MVLRSTLRDAGCGVSVSYLCFEDPHLRPEVEVEVAHPRLLLHLGFARKLIEGIDIVMAALQPGLAVLTRQAFTATREECVVSCSPACASAQQDDAPLVLVLLSDCHVLLPETATSCSVLLVTIVKAFVGLPAVAVPPGVFDDCNLPPAGAMVAQSMRTTAGGAVEAQQACRMTTCGALLLLLFLLLFYCCFAVLSTLHAILLFCRGGVRSRGRYHFAVNVPCGHCRGRRGFAGGQFSELGCMGKRCGRGGGPHGRHRCV